MESSQQDPYSISTSTETFTYVMRDDTDSVIDGFVSRAQDQGRTINEEQTDSLKLEYKKFVSELMKVYEKYSGDRKTNVLLVDSAEINRVRNQKIQTYIDQHGKDYVIVTMDPLCDFPNTMSFAVSRLFDAKGLVSTKLTNRPGSDTITHQIAAIQNAAQGKEIILVEDDLFSGSTIQRTMNLFRGEQLNGSSVPVSVCALFPGVQALADKPLDINEDLHIDPVYTINIVKGHDIEDVLDIGDPRDFLIGGDGLVTDVGRMPYVLPFVSPSARATVPKDLEIDFSESVLALTSDFYRSAESITGFVWAPSLCQPSSQQGLQHHGFADSQSICSMVDVTRLANNMLHKPSKRHSAPIL